MEIVAQLKARLRSEKTVKRYRVNDQDWTRERKLTFERVATLILRGHKLSEQNAVNRLFRELGKVEEVATASAYSQARQKLKPELFIDLNELVVSNFYQRYEEDVQHWDGRRLIGVDVSI
ncbi:MAG: hypothetical protein AB1489_42895 [Acidobacteriota bacterium]